MKFILGFICGSLVAHLNAKILADMAKREEEKLLLAERKEEDERRERLRVMFDYGQDSRKCKEKSEEKKIETHQNYLHREKQARMLKRGWKKHQESQKTKHEGNKNE